MEKPTWIWWLTAAANLLLLCLADESNLKAAVESPQYTAVHEESNFEIRLYRATAWMSAPAKEISFQIATFDGFLRLVEYTLGGNLNCSVIPLTVPILTSIVPGAGPLYSSAYLVSLYLPSKFQSSPPLPRPELDLKPHSWTSRCIAVRKFSGYANDVNVVQEAEQLSISLGKSPWANATSLMTDFAYSVAQYSSPLQLVFRVNEIWVELNQYAVDGCRSNGIAKY